MRTVSVSAIDNYLWINLYKDYSFDQPFSPKCIWTKKRDSKMSSNARRRLMRDFKRLSSDAPEGKYCLQFY